MSNHDDNAGKDLGFVHRWSARKKQQAETVDTQPMVDENDSGNRQILDSVEPNPSSTDAIYTEANHAYQPSEQPNVDIQDTESEDSSVLLTDEDMPQIETLTAKSDLSDFFNKGVSAGLRRAALRHVFQLPVYNERDGLNDYDDDFTRFEPLGDTITSDMKWHKARKEREAEEAEAELRAEEQLEHEQAGHDVEDANDQSDAQQAEGRDDQNDDVSESTEDDIDNSSDGNSKADAENSDVDKPLDSSAQSDIDSEIHSKDDELEGIPT